jgi:hypothetical protein
VFINFVKQVNIKHNEKSLILIGMVCSMTMLGQAKEDAKIGTQIRGSYFTQTAATEFPCGWSLPNKDVYSGTLQNNKLISRESVVIW